MMTSNRPSSPSGDGGSRTPASKVTIITVASRLSAALESSWSALAASIGKVSANTFSRPVVPPHPVHAQTTLTADSAIASAGARTRGGFIAVRIALAPAAERVKLVRQTGGLPATRHPRTAPIDERIGRRETA